MNSQSSCFQFILDQLGKEMLIFGNNATYLFDMHI